jgi:hypothetical protein
LWETILPSGKVELEVEFLCGTGRGDEQFTKKQINEKQKKGWHVGGKNNLKSGVVRGWMVRKVNSEQKKSGRSERQVPNRQLDPTR